MIRFLASSLALALALVAGPTAEPVKNNGVTHVDPPDAAKLLAVKDPARKPVILDVRTPLEFNGIRIANSKNIDFVDRSFETELAKLDKNTPYLVHCQSGSRSQRSLATFKKLGFTELYHLDGGILAWMKQDLPVTK